VATSSTTTFNLSAQDFIDLSLVDVGAVGPEGGTSPNLRPHALKLLNIIVKTLDIKGILTWRAPRRTTTLTASQASYALGSDAYDIDEPARYTQAGDTYSSQVTPMARDEYMSLPDRTLVGPPIRYYVERALDASTGLVALTMYLYPIPPNTGDTIELATQVRSKDLTDLAQTLDVTQKWMDAIRWRLTHDLCPAYNVPIDRMSYFRKLAETALDEALGDDNERGNVQFVPFGNQSYWYGYRGSGV
jgi:hypothetical protein